MSLDTSNHYVSGMDGVVLNHGTASFSDDSLTKIVPHSYTQLRSAMITPTTATNSQENYYATLSSGVVTITRVVQSKSLGLALDEPASGTNYDIPIMVAQHDMVITSVDWYQEVDWGSGTPLLNVGTTADSTAILSSGSITDTDTTLTEFTISNVSVSAGDVITLETTGGLTTVATGCSVTIGYTTPTSDLNFSYHLWGI